MTRFSNDELPSDAPIMSRSVMNYVKWKHKAQKSQQLLVISAILLGATTIGIVLFVLIISGVITNETSSQVKITKHSIGSSDKGEEIFRYTLSNDRGLVLQVMTLGCTVTSLSAPDRNTQSEGVLLGYDNLEEYDAVAAHPAANSVVGRLAGLNSTGWEQVIWEATTSSDDVTFSHVSPDGDQGFPGEIHVNVSFSLTTENEVMVIYSATVRENPSPIDLSSYFRFNLAGQEHSNITDHELTVFAERYLPLSPDGTPTGDISTVEGTYYDMRTPTLLSSKLSDGGHDGFSQNYCLRGPSGKRLAASGRTLEVYTNQPSLYVSWTDAGSSPVHQLEGLSLASHNYPHALSYTNFPDCILHPGSTYLHTTWYKFGTNL